LQLARRWWNSEAGFEIEIPLETAISYMARTRGPLTTATEQLRHEHEALTLVLSILEQLCRQLARGEEVNPEHFGQLLEFIQVIGDQCHHAKEEEFLFPAMEVAGVPKASKVLDVMTDHEKCRILIRQLAAAWRKHRFGDPAGARAVITSARDYSEFLQDHIREEDDVLYPLAEARLPADVQRRLLEQFKRLEIERIGAGRYEQFHKSLDFLKQNYLDRSDDGPEKIQRPPRTGFLSELASRWKLGIKGLINQLSRR
jgi:hemerythrin-like domain-containing protein